MRERQFCLWRLVSYKNADSLLKFEIVMVLNECLMLILARYENTHS